MDIFEIIVNWIGYAIAPIHELGHVVFGWISFNPTEIIAWDRVRATRPGWFLDFGGMMGEFIAWFLLAHFVGKKAKWVYIWTIGLTLVSLTAIIYQTDNEGHSPLMPALWYIFGSASIVWQIVFLYRGLRWPETEKSRKQGTRQTGQGKGGLISLLAAVPSPSQVIQNVVGAGKAQNRTTASCSRPSKTTNA